MKLQELSNILDDADFSKKDYEHHAEMRFMECFSKTTCRALLEVALEAKDLLINNNCHDPNYPIQWLEKALEDLEA